MHQKTTNNWFNIGLGVISGLVAIGVLFVAIKKPWVATYYQEVEGYNLHTPKLTIPVPSTLNSNDEKVNGVLFYLAHSTDVNNAKYDVDASCLQQFIGAEDKLFLEAMNHINRRYGNTPRAVTVTATEQLFLRFSLLFGDSAELKLISGKSVAKQEHVSFSELRELIGTKTSKISNHELLTSVRECYRIITKP